MSIEALQKDTGRTAGWTCATGLTQLVGAIRGDTGQMFTASAVLEGEYGLTGLRMSVPVKIGRSGIEEILEWELAPDEQAALAGCARELNAAAQTVDRVLAG